MAVYGISLYGGTTFYGSFSPEAFRVQNFNAATLNYDTIILDWQNPPAGDWDELRLVRSSYGHPMSVTEGVTLFTDPDELARTNFTDTGPLTPGRFYYYTLFVRETASEAYVVAGVQTELVPVDYRSGDRMWELLPSLYRDGDEEAPRDGTQTTGPLYRFLQLFGYQLDRLRTESDTLRDVMNVDRVSGGLLPLMADMMGVGYEPELGMRISRSLAKNYVHLVKTKGTRPGIEGAASAYTGFGAVAVVGKNALLDYNDSEFRESIGHWAAVQNVTLARVAEADYSPAIAATNSMSLTAGAAGTDAIATVGTFADKTLVLVRPEQEWTASAYFSAPADGTIRDVQIGIIYYDADGVVLLAVDSPVESDALGSWTRVEMTATAPANALWASLRATIVTPADGEIHYLGAVQFEQTSATDSLRYFELEGTYADQTQTYEEWGNL